MSSKRKGLMFFPLMGGWFIVWALAAVWIRHATVKTSFEVNQKRNRINELKEESVRLQSKLEQMQSPARLEKLAKDRFGLGPAKKEQIWNVSER